MGNRGHDMLRLVSTWLYLDFEHLKAATFDFEVIETPAKSAGSTVLQRMRRIARTAHRIFK